MSNAPDWQLRQSDFFDSELPAPSNAGHLRPSDEKLRDLRPEFYGFSGLIYSLFVLLRQQFNDKQFIRECLDGGDCRAAVVVSLHPLLVAAYSDELDAVAMLRCPDHLVQKYGLSVGTRLLTVNNYGAGSDAMDLVPGPKNSGNWDNIIPTIAEFVSDDLAEIDRLKRQIREREWRRALAMGQHYLKALPGVYRDGRPFFSGLPRAAAAEYATNLHRSQKTRMLIVGGGGASALLLLLMCGGVASLMVGGGGGERGGAAAPNAPGAGRLQAIPGPPGMPIRPQAAASSFVAGENVEVYFAGHWVPGEVLRVMPDGFLSLGLTNGARPILPPHLVRKPNAAQGPSLAASGPPQPHPATYRPIAPQPSATPQSAEPQPASPQPAATQQTTTISPSSKSEGAPLAKPNRPDPFATRSWEDSTGRFKIEARFLSFRGGVVHLEKVDGSALRIPLEKLSAQDQQFVQSQSGDE